jgi:hypothetical protein
MPQTPIGGQACCILEVCCGAEQQDKALGDQLKEQFPFLNEQKAYEVAEFILDTYDLAPVGSLKDFKRTIAALARAYPAQPGY